MELAVHLENQSSPTGGYKSGGYRPSPERSYIAKTSGNNNFGGNFTFTNQPAVISKNTNNPPIFKRLSPTERRERTAKGLCSNCDEKFVPWHKCKGRLFRFSAEDNTLWELEGDDAEG